MNRSAPPLGRRTYVSSPYARWIYLGCGGLFLLYYSAMERYDKSFAFSPDQSYISVQINSNRCFARTFGNNTIIERRNTIETSPVSRKPVACIPSRYFYMHVFDGMHASCITGAVSILSDSHASFAGKTVFANNIAEFGGTTVTCTRFYESQVTTNKTLPARGYSGRAVLPGLWRHTNVL